MDPGRRKLLQSIGGAALVGALPAGLVQRVAAATPAALAQDDEFWAAVRAHYRVPDDWINLEGG
jgi:hypothetical protein